MRMTPTRSQAAFNAASRQQNPAWPWIAGGVAAAAGVGAYFCWPRDVADDTIMVEGFTIQRKIHFKGCAAKLPYAVTLQGEGPGGSLSATGSFKTLAEAQAWGGDTADTADAGNGNGPTDPPPPAGPQANPHVRGPGAPRVAPSFAGRPRAPRAVPGKPVPPGKLPPVCPAGYQYSLVTRQCEPGKVPPPPRPPVGPGKHPTGLAGVPKPLPGYPQLPPGVRRPGMPPQLDRNPLATLFSPALYGYGMAPYMYPETAFGGYGTALLV